MLACKCNGAHPQPGGQCINVVLAVPLHIWQVLCDGNNRRKNGDKTGHKSAATANCLMHVLQHKVQQQYGSGQCIRFQAGPRKLYLQYIVLTCMSKSCVGHDVVPTHIRAKTSHVCLHTLVMSSMSCQAFCSPNTGTCIAEGSRDNWAPDKGQPQSSSDSMIHPKIQQETPHSSNDHEGCHRKALQPQRWHTVYGAQKQAKTVQLGD